MADERPGLLLVADFTLDILRGYLASEAAEPGLAVTSAPYGPVVPILDGLLGADREELGFVAVWTQPELISAEFQSVLRFEPHDLEAILEDVDRFSRRLLELGQRARFVLVPAWSAPAAGRGYGMLDMSQGVTHVLAAMNGRLCQNLREASSIAVLDTQRWLRQCGERAYSAKLWYAAKVPFGHAVFQAAAADMKAALRGALGQSKKLIALDLDHTLWGGVVGEVGWKNLRLGGHDAIGEAFVDFQRDLKSLTNRGLLLAVVSKNTESVALEAMEKHPEMVLGQDDLAGWRINWQDKARNLVELVEELNLGLSSVVFIDDNPVERDRVRDALPEILVPEWPKSPLLYLDALRALDCFDTPYIGEEDRKRSDMYVGQRKRRQAQSGFKSADDWLSSLGTRVTVEELGEDNLPRAAQLLNKTNQMNMRTRRMTEAELEDWAAAPDRHVWAFRVSDRFGDSGICGVLSLAAEGGCGHIMDFVLSCRVIGRRVEETMVHVAVEAAIAAGLGQVKAEFQPTDRNQPCLEFWCRSGLDHEESTHTFTWSTTSAYPKPDVVELEGVGV